MALISQSDYARARGVSRQAISKAVRAGKILLVDGKVDAGQADTAWGEIRETETPVSRPAGGGVLPLAHESRAAKLAFEARLAKLEFEQRSGKLVEIVAVNAFVAGMIVKARNELVRIGAELADELGRETDPAKCRAHVDDRIFQALENLKQYRPA